ncbi:MAG: Tm-1-like ATP-binding domain-containing protein [Planctomycetota bacterium]
MATRIAIIACLDTKGDEAKFLTERVEAAGGSGLLIDTGIVGDALVEAGVTAETVAQAAGTTIAELRQRNDRGHAVKLMSEGAALVVRSLFDDGEIDGVLGAGGSANTTIASAAMRALPVGFPKVLVSTLASGNVAPYVDTKDITLMYSVVDIAGINRLSARILGNAARAVVAMATGKEETSSRPILAATMFGVTTPCVTTARKRLEESGYEVLVFHATGSGGRAMEGLIEDGYIAGVLDVTTTEIADELVGGILSAGPDRLRAAGRAAIPQVVSIGAIDMVNFGPRDTVPAEFEGRKFYEHNQTVTLMRTTAEECARIGQTIANRLREARGPVDVLLPKQGVSLISKEGETFFDPEADAACREAIRHGLEGSAAEVEEISCDVNNEAFAQILADRLLSRL